MTAPTQQQRTQAQRRQAAAEAATAAAIAALLAGPSIPGASIVAKLTRLGVPRIAASAAVTLLTTHPEPARLVTGSAGRKVRELNTLRRAQYLVAASRRIARTLAEAKSRGVTRRQAVSTALHRERSYYAAHTRAQTNRRQAAEQVDRAAQRHGEAEPAPRRRRGNVTTVTPGRVLLGWWSVRDARTTPECRAAHGRNFFADQPPRIGYPGMTHPNCRCVAVPPWPTRQLVGGGTVPEPAKAA